MSTPAYDRIADWYNESIQNGSLIHNLIVPALFVLMGDMQGKRVCDLACGQGVIARQLAQRGASVTGIDVAENMLTYARKHKQNEPLDITYLHDDAQSLTAIPDASFDGVVCNMSLMDIPDMHATFCAVYRVLRNEGWFVFSLTHPCFQAPNSFWTENKDGVTYRAVRDYFTEQFWRSANPNGVRGQVGAYHRTLSTYINALMEIGLLIERFVEPQATGEIAANIPGYAEIPAALVIRCRKI